MASLEAKRAACRWIFSKDEDNVVISREEEIPLFFVCARMKFLDFSCMFATLQKNSEGNSLSNNKEKKKK